MTRNAQMFNDVAETIVAESQLWSQRGYTTACSASDLTEITVDVRETPVLCASSQCVAGWTVALASKELLLECVKGEKDFHDEAAAILGLDEFEADWLFLDCQTDYPGQMAATLRALADGADLDEASRVYARSF